MSSALKHRNFWIVCGGGFVFLVIYLSLTPHPLDVPSWWNFKIGHILAYAWLMFWFSQIYPRLGQRVVLGSAFLALGIALEYVQGLLGRDFSYTDMRDDGIGLVLGFALGLTPLGRALIVLDAYWAGARAGERK